MMQKTLSLNGKLQGCDHENAAKRIKLQVGSSPIDPGA